MTRTPFSSGSRQSDTTQAAVAKARGSRLVPVREATVVARPSNVSMTYLEAEYDELVIEQLRGHAAVGEQEAATPSATAASLAPARQAQHSTIAIKQADALAAQQRYEHLVEVLGPFAKRKEGSRIGYFFVLVGLLLGDIAGLAGAAISYGEVPLLAVMQAVSASVATVVAGSVGAEFKYLKQARERHSEEDELSKELRPYGALLLGPLVGRRFVATATTVATMIALFVAVGIGALRMSIEGQVAGLVFGALAIGIAAGSWVNSFRYADAVADKIEASRQGYQRAQRTYLRASTSRRLRQAERAIEQARIIREEHRLRGEAAAAKVTALKFEALQQSPDVVGHGIAAGEIGRKPRPAVAGRGWPIEGQGIVTLFQARLVPSQLIGMGSGVTLVQQRKGSEVAFMLPHPGTCSGEKTLTIALFDDSGSVAGLGGNDPISHRYHEARIAFEHVAAACTCGKEFGAVLHFNHPSSRDIPPTRLGGRGIRRLERGLRVPSGEYGTSDLGPALSAARAMAEQFNGDHVTLMIFSDFMLTDPDPAAVYADMFSFPGVVCNVILASTVPQALMDAPNSTLHEIDSAAEPGAIAHAVYDGLTQSRIGAVSS